jgi:pectinesterase
MTHSVQGAVDFIFGRIGLAFFGGNTIGVSDPGCVTASGRTSDDRGGCKIVLAPGAASGASGNIYLGRPWGCGFIFLSLFA